MKRRAARVSRKTHRAIRSSGGVDTGKLTTSNSIGPCCKHFFPCNEGAGTTVTDIVNGVVLDNAETDVSVGVGDANTMRMLSWPNVGGGNQITGSWEAPVDKDVLIVACAKARDGGVTNGGGHISFYLGDNASSGQLKVQPYYAVFSAGLSDPAGGFGTLRSSDYAIRTNGQDYIFAAAKHGNLLKHWADGTLTDSQDVSVAHPDIISAWNNFNPASSFYCGHSAAGGTVQQCTPASIFLFPEPTEGFSGIACDYTYEGWALQDDGNRQKPGEFNNVIGATEVAQDYYGIAIFVFENGLPDDVSEAIAWMKSQWVVGNKALWPGWVSLT